MRALIVGLGFTGLILASLAGPAAGQGRAPSLVRDAEIERIIRDYSTPIFMAAGLEPDSVQIHLVNDPALNAFVAGGQRLFMHTGLLLRAETPNQVAGVIAHEAGHIAGGHLARLQDELRNAEAKSILAFVLGTAAALATGDSRAAGAVVVGGQDIAIKDLLRYTRQQESAADQAGMRFLDRSGQSSRGLLEFFRILQSNEALTGRGGNPYLQTHPLTGDRITTVANHVALSRWSDAPVPPEQQARHDRVRAKIAGFLATFDDVMRRYPDSDVSLPARYARAIAWYRLPDLKQALPLVDGLIAEEPDNPWFHELRGQMLFENGLVAESLPSSQRAVDLAPDEGLLRIGLAKAQIETGDDALLEPAKRNLIAAQARETGVAELWRLLSVVHGRLGETGLTALAQAEYAMRRGERPLAKAHATRAEDMLPVGSPGWLRAQDLSRQLKR
ncbi:MAG: M48 family metallopeptidase [Alphaproteobacteria bacterium]|nr:M48 family metallopeptidase [Alphaproteobacteria bacterium]